MTHNVYKKFDTLTCTIRDLHTFQILVLIHKFLSQKISYPLFKTNNLRLSLLNSYNYLNHSSVPRVFFANTHTHTLMTLSHSHDTRSRDKLHLTRCKTTYGSKSLRYKGSNLWNQLTNDLKIMTFPNSFKNNL